MSVLNLGYAHGDGCSLANDCESFDTAYDWKMLRLAHSYVLCLSDVHTGHVMAEVRPKIPGAGWEILLHCVGVYNSVGWEYSVRDAITWAERQIQERRRLGY